MNMTYKHGVYGSIVPTTDILPPTGVATLPVYVGTAPVDTLEDYSQVINRPVIVYSFDDAKAKFGYSGDWVKYTLCEAMYAHFKNSLQNMGPIVLINVWDPAADPDVSTIADADIIGGIDADGKRTGFACVDLIYQMYGMIPTILAAPGWSQKPTIKEKMVSQAQKINGHWDAIVVADIDSSAAKTIDAAISWKGTNKYDSNIIKLCWPKIKYSGKIFWLSTLTVVRMQQTDYSNDNIPYESPSNKPIMANGTVLADGSDIFFDEQQANTLNAEGITTAAYTGGQWRLWGPHMGNYKDGTEIDPKDMFDSSVRMMQYLTNTFQSRYMSNIDSPMDRRKVDTILNDAQIWLNSLITEGKLLYGEIAFNETSNPTSNIVEGDFVFDIRTTTTPPGKSLTFNVQYTTAGLNALLGGEQ